MYRSCELTRLFHPVEIASGTRGLRYHNPGLDRVLSSVLVMIHHLDWHRGRALVSAILSMTICPVVSADEPSFAVRISERFAARAESSTAGPSLKMDYGSFQWWLLDAGGVADLSADGIAFQIIEDPYVLTLGDERFDPLFGLPTLPLDWAGSGHPGTDLHLVQAAAPIRPEWLGELRSLGLEPLQYIHPFTYVVWGTRAETEASERLPWVRWRGEFAPGYRVLPRWRRMESPALEVEILVPNVANPARVTAALEAIGATPSGSARLNPTWTIVTVVLRSDSMAAAAAIPGVYSIQPAPTDGGARGEMSNQVCAGNIDGGNIAFPGYPGWLDTLSLDGSSVIMANVDQGADENHPDLARSISPMHRNDLRRRRHVQPRHPHRGDPGGHRELRGELIGISPRASGWRPGPVWWSSSTRPSTANPTGCCCSWPSPSPTAPPLSSNSWGPSGTPHGYDNDTMQIDIGVRDVDPAIHRAIRL